MFDSCIARLETGQGALVSDWYDRLKPGAHFIAITSRLNYHRLTCDIEDAGFEIRDQIIVLGAEHRYSIALARKPLIGTVVANVLEHGTGALNIEATRVNLQTGEVKVGGFGNGGIGFGGGDGKNVEWQENSQGRWPANILIFHSPQCAQTGTRSDRIAAGVRTANFGTQETISGGNGSGGERDYLIEVAVWECANDCPTRMFPETAGGAAPKKSNTPSGKFYKGGWNPLQSEKRVEFPAGSASRFFQSVKSETELYAYLIRLITPPNGSILNPLNDTTIDEVIRREGLQSA